MKDITNYECTHGCVALCGESPEWPVLGEFDTEGVFTPDEREDTRCQDCGEWGERA